MKRFDPAWARKVWFVSPGPKAGGGLKLSRLSGGFVPRKFPPAPKPGAD